MKVEPVGTRASAALNLLKRHRVLGAAPDSELQSLIQRAQVVIVSEREMLFRRGDPGRAVAVPLTGFIKLSTLEAGGKEVVLEICGPGSLFGELACLNNWPRAADAMALSDCEILSIPGEALKAVLVRSPEAMFALLGVVSRRLTHATEQIRDGAALPGPARLAKALVELAAAHAKPSGSRLVIEFALSQRELGGMTGLSRETINKQLAAWRDQGWIELSPGHIGLLAAESLRTLVDEALEA
ncbi:MAG TPA: Crp/Fnr family transcriptional regulator [Acetobacteraceae bacterium]|jgi:CRP-like cAMP-binding protein|nr:Crp/Fnr family transcriptional regulator [Acetobacteraceae bacterium]